MPLEKAQEWTTSADKLMTTLATDLKVAKRCL
jgi:hypothetical protein